MIRLGVFILFMLIHGYSSAMIEVKEFGNNPGKLRMFIHIPENLSSNAPMVVALHGCSQTAEELAQLTGWNELADKYGFVVLYPEQRSVNNMSSCFNWFMMKDIEGDKGESESIRSMMDKAALMTSINSELIYTYGVSAGAAMANSLMITHPEAFAGGAILAGGAHRSAENAMQAMQVMMYPKDRTVSEWGKKIPNTVSFDHLPKVVVVQGSKDNVVDPANAIEIIDQWCFAYDINPNDQQVDTTFVVSKIVERSYLKDKKGAESIVYFSIEGLGHKIPVDPGENIGQGGQTGMFAEDIDFFSTYYIAVEFGLIRTL